MPRFEGIEPLGITGLRFANDLSNLPPEVRLEELFPPEEVEEWGINFNKEPVDGFIVDTLWRPGTLASHAKEDIGMGSFKEDDVSDEGVECVDSDTDDIDPEIEYWDLISRFGDGEHDGLALVNAIVQPEEKEKKDRNSSFSKFVPLSHKRVRETKSFSL